MEYHEIEFEKIDLEDETFRISEDLVPAPMAASIGAVGQLNPVLLYEAGSRYGIVCGFRRVHALRRLDASRVTARVVEGKIAEPGNLFDLALRDNLAHRLLDPLEKARAVFKLKNDFGVSDEILMETYLPLLELPARKQSLKVQWMLHESGPDIRNHLKEGRWTPASAERLAEMTAASREAVVSVMGKMRLSASSQRKFFALLADLAAMTDTKPESIFRDPQVHAVLGNESLSPGERGERVYALLYRFRYPRLSQAEARFLERRKMLGLPGSVSITADPYFENPDVHVEFKARNAGDFRRLAKKLYEASRNPELDGLFGTD